MQSCIHWCKIRFFQKDFQLIIILEMNAMKQILSITPRKLAWNCLLLGMARGKSRGAPFGPFNHAYAFSN